VESSYGECGSSIPLSRLVGLGSVVSSPSRGLTENEFIAHLGFGEHSNRSSSAAKVYRNYIDKYQELCIMESIKPKTNCIRNSTARICSSVMWHFACSNEATLAGCPLVKSRNGGVEALSCRCKHIPVPLPLSH